MSHFRWLTTNNRAPSTTSADYYAIDGEDETDMSISSPEIDSQSVRMIVAFHSLITHEESTRDDVLAVLTNFPHLVNDEIYLDETKGRTIRARGVSPLRNALLYGKWDIAECLVERGANLHVLMDHAGSKICALSYACIAGQFKLVRAMLDRNVKGRSFFLKTEAPHIPISGGRMRLDSKSSIGSVEAIGQDGVNVNEKDDDLNFPLYWACLYGHRDVARLLLETKNREIGCRETEKSKDTAKREAVPLPAPIVQPPRVAPSTSSFQALSSSYLGGGSAGVLPSIDPDPLDLSNNGINGINGNNGNNNHTGGHGHGRGIVDPSVGAPLEDFKTVDIHATNRFGWNAFTCCCVSGDYELAMDMIALGVTTTLVDARGLSPIYLCCQRGHSDIVLALLVLGHDINMVGPEQEGNMSLLHTAIASGHTRTSVILIERGCAVDTVCSGGRTPFYLAAKYGMVEVVEAIVRRFVGEVDLSSSLPASNPDSDSRRGSNSRTNKSRSKKKLGDSSSVQREKLTQYVRKATNNGDTPLHAAAHSGMLSMVFLLLTIHADLWALGAQGDNILHAACRRDACNGTMVAHLLSEVNLAHVVRTGPASNRDNKDSLPSVSSLLGRCNSGGEAPLHVAAYSQAGEHMINAICVSMQELELDSTLRLALLNQRKEASGETPLHIACRYANHEAAVSLVIWGSDLSVRDKNGFSALQLLLEPFSHFSTTGSARNRGSHSGADGPEDSNAQGSGIVHSEVTRKSLYAALVQAALDSNSQPAGFHLLLQEHFNNSLELGASGTCPTSPGKEGTLASRMLLRKPGSFIDVSSAINSRKGMSRSNSNASVASKVSAGSYGNSHAASEGLGSSVRDEELGLGVAHRERERASDSSTRSGRALGYSVL